MSRLFYFELLLKRILKENIMKKLALILFIVINCCVWTAYSQTTASDADKAAIKQTALDYIEGWYEGDAERMERALHPDLAKRIVQKNPQGGQDLLGHMTAPQLIQGVKSGYGKQTPKDKQQKDVTILDVFENSASVKIVATAWIDYLHIAKFNGRWVIVNVLWEMKPAKK